LELLAGQKVGKPSPAVEDAEVWEDFLVGVPQQLLVGGFNPFEKYVSVGIIIPIYEKNTCSKPPTRLVIRSVL